MRKGKTPESKKMMGDRKINSDGFTYVYGAVRDGSATGKTPQRASVKRSIRSDKRGVKNKELKRINKEELDNE